VKKLLVQTNCKGNARTRQEMPAAKWQKFKNFPGISTKEPDKILLNLENLSGILMDF